MEAKKIDTTRNIYSKTSFTKLYMNVWELDEKSLMSQSSLLNKSQSSLVEILVENETFLTILIDKDK
jgi:hypothetical protein